MENLYYYLDKGSHWVKRKAENDPLTRIDRMLLAAEIVAKLEVDLGSESLNLIGKMITETYLGGEMDLRTAILERPAVVRRAFVEILGDVGEVLLMNACKNSYAKFGVDKSECCSEPGDFAKCVISSDITFSKN